MSSRGLAGPFSMAVRNNQQGRKDRTRAGETSCLEEAEDPDEEDDEKVAVGDEAGKMVTLGISLPLRCRVKEYRNKDKVKEGVVVSCNLNQFQFD